jgi:hypothetical protein
MVVTEIVIVLRWCLFGDHWAVDVLGGAGHPKVVTVEPCIEARLSRRSQVRLVVDLRLEDAGWKGTCRRCQARALIR